MDNWFDDISTIVERGINSRNSHSIKRRNIRYTPSANTQITEVSQLKRRKSPRFIVNGNWAPPKIVCQQNAVTACIINSDEITEFENLLTTDNVIQKFLNFDKCFKYADSYLLAMVFVYFKRCNMKLHEYNRMNFFSCLYLAHDIEEDDEDLKYEIFPWALGTRWRNNIASFLHKKECIWARMNYRAIVTAKCCEELFKLFNNKALWNRVRPQHHGGARRTYLKSPFSNMPKGPKAPPAYCKLCHNWERPNPDLNHFVGFNKKAYIGFSENEVDESCSGTTPSYQNLSFEDENWLSQETLPPGGEFLLAEV